MTQKEILQTALAQSAIDLNCRPEDLTSGKKVVVESKPHPKARAYLKLPFACNLVSYGGGVVASVSPEVREIVTAYIEKYPVEHLFETPNLHALDDALVPYSLRSCFMAEYFLPDLNALKPHDRSNSLRNSCRIHVKILFSKIFVRFSFLKRFIEVEALLGDRKSVV